MTEISHPAARITPPEDSIAGQLMVIDADETTANNVVGLICAASNIIEGIPMRETTLRRAFELPENPTEQLGVFRDVFRSRGFFEQFSHSFDFPLAVALAATAWPDKAFVYAIHKLSRSLETESITWWSTHPRYGQIFDKHSELYSSHVSTSIAINLAFSAIEELKLQVKSSATKARFLAGDWNPAVLKDVQERLQNEGIDVGQKMNWIVRGDKSILEESIKPTLGAPAPYSDGQVVRDVELSIPEALHFSSFIRNFMTAHGFSEVSAFLVSVPKHVESNESVVIQGERPDSMGTRRQCGLPRTVHATTAAACAIRAT
ncbi:hypothetical protein HAP41_0000013070 [Bradyrhizobium barranii subsp. apii]|uniref:Uncharacterized protein n=1 Tax=Bradyrhizobium barranii subsp. apii TaxID=2819348 RepID=A0A8T5VEG5_9BRAD|nr:hypothetical protein [Bradyrhizobium barranii]UPT89819.1 hypothetical protein HAP41_0000013070 [Bradyrhizobium barranii subsp. apii]